MAAGPETLLSYIRRLVPQPPSVSPPDPGGRHRAGAGEGKGEGDTTDAALLGRFISQRDERAFAALVDRHGSLVLQVCQRILGDVHDAEDAFQAVFLILARKAATVHRREALTAWLHGVARRVALKARAARDRQFRDGWPLAMPLAGPSPDPLADISGRELLMIIDEELQRLAEVYRLPVILCCLEGRSLEEAARQLGWTRGSVKGRLERGRARLHDRLVRRGLTLSAALAAAEVSRATASAAVIARLVAATAQGALAFGAYQTVAAPVVSAGAADLARQTLKAMGLAKLKIAVAVLLPTCVVAVAFGIHQRYSSLRNSAPSAVQNLNRGVRGVTRSPAALATNPHPSPLPPVGEGQGGGDEADAPIEVRGRVFDPMGKPLAGANLYVGYSVHRFTPDVEANVQSRQVSYRRRATSEVDGQFHFTFTTSELDARGLDDWRPAVIAVADGYGPDWAEVVESDKSRQLSLKLVEDLPVTGRILDPNNKPVAGAKVLICNVLSDSEEGVDRYFRGQINAWYPRIWRGPFPEQPPGVTTDTDGRFHLTGLGRDRIVNVALEGSKIPDTSFSVVTRQSAATPAGFQAATFDYVTRPSRSISGVVRDKATGLPLAGVKVSAQRATTLTEENGRFEIVGCAKAQGYLARAQPQTGQPYFAASACVKEKAGSDPLIVDFDLVSGILLSGRVTDASRQTPPRAAVVEYYPLFPNTHSSMLSYGYSQAASSATVGPDGSYSLVVLPGPGVVCVAASPRNPYAAAIVDDPELTKHLHQGRNQDVAQCQCLCTDLGAGAQGSLDIDKYNVLSPINPDAGMKSMTLDLALQPARMVHGEVIGPDGKPLTGVRVIGLTATPDDERLESASFTVTGLNPRRGRELFFQHAGNNLGKHLTLRGDETEPLTVRLEPCGSVIGRMVDKRGNPAPGVAVFFKPWDDMAQTDRDGRFHMSLVPDQKYTFYMYRHLLKDVGQFAVESGRTKDLGVLTLEDDRPTGPNEINASRKEVDGR